MARHDADGRCRRRTLFLTFLAYVCVWKFCNFKQSVVQDLNLGPQVMTGPATCKRAIQIIKHEPHFDLMVTDHWSHIGFIG